MSTRKWGCAGRNQLLKHLVWEERSPHLASNWPMWLQGPSWAAVWHGASFSLLVPAVAWLVVGPTLSSSHFKQRQGRGSSRPAGAHVQFGFFWLKGWNNLQAPTTPFTSTVSQTCREGNAFEAGTHSWRQVGKLGSSWQHPPKSQVCLAPHCPAQSRVSASAPLPLAPSSFLSALVLSSLAWCGRPSPCCRVCLLPPSARGHLRENTGFQPVAGCDHRT